MQSVEQDRIRHQCLQTSIDAGQEPVAARQDEATAASTETPHPLTRTPPALLLSGHPG
jgi:hypothetical protein